MKLCSPVYYKILHLTTCVCVCVFQHPVSVWRLVTFVSPLMFVLAIQRSTRPMLNLLVAHYSPSKTAADLSVAVLSVTYPLGHICYGWLNQLRPIPPTFREVG